MLSGPGAGKSTERASSQLNRPASAKSAASMTSDDSSRGASCRANSLAKLAAASHARLTPPAFSAVSTPPAEAVWEPEPEPAVTAEQAAQAAPAEVLQAEAPLLVQSPSSHHQGACPGEMRHNNTPDRTGRVKSLQVNADSASPASQASPLMRNCDQLGKPEQQQGSSWQYTGAGMLHEHVPAGSPSHHDSAATCHPTSLGHHPFAHPEPHTEAHAAAEERCSAVAVRSLQPPQPGHHDVADIQKLIERAERLQQAMDRALALQMSHRWVAFMVPCPHSINQLQLSKDWHKHDVPASWCVVQGMAPVRH